YAQDDFRVLANVSLNYGLRYEYFGPFTEKNNRLVNLDHNADFTQFAVVLPNAQGPFQGKFNSSLVNPDHTMFAPRLALAWRPKVKSAAIKDVVVRAGYGMNYNTGQYAIFARSLSHQGQFANTQNNNLTSGCTTLTPSTPNPNMTLAHGFGCAVQTIQNNYAVDKNYRLGMVQVFNVNVQKTIPLNIVLNIGYNGTTAGNLDVVGSPNVTPQGTTTPTVAAFDFERSIGSSHSNALVISA